MILKDLMNDGNKDFDINFEEDYYIKINRNILHKNFEVNNKSDICSIGEKNKANKRIDSFFISNVNNSKVNNIIYLENLKLFMACDSRTILLINDKFKLIGIMHSDDNLRTLCDLKLRHNSRNLNWIASGGECLIIYEIDEACHSQGTMIAGYFGGFIYHRQKNGPHIQPQKRFDNNRNINKIILLNNQGIMGRIAVCDDFGFIGIYKLYNPNDIQFSFKMLCHSYINCILYLSDENILVSGSDRDQNLKFWRIQETSNKLELVNSFNNIYSTISNNSLLDINKKILVGQKNGIRVSHHEQGIIRNCLFLIMKNLGMNLGVYFQLNL